MIPCKFRDELDIETRVVEWREKFFRLEHTVRKAGQVALVGSELRFMGIADPEDPAKLRAAVIPQEFRDALAGDH
jgi:acyl-CoA thioesterase FadM